MKIEVHIIAVADVDRVLHFYQGLGWRLDADFEAGPEFRIVQRTLRGSECSIIFGRDPDGRSYASCASFRDPDGNGWTLQEVQEWLPGW
ncbi:hypothetical protein [Streptomyces sp. NPDC059378]|uniref:hypothetical protein n=1 Tax=Streptomyces sp. NPDC059378 TaxID=3346815 RepID=UPI00369A58D9